MEKEPKGLKVIKEDTIPKEEKELVTIEKEENKPVNEENKIIENNLNDGKKEEKNTEVKVKKKKKLKTRTKVLIIVIVLCILLTTVLTILKIKSINENKNKGEEKIQEKVEDAFVTEETTKKKAEDAIYLCESFEETYNKNDLEIKTVNEGDNPEDYSARKYTRISYVQISGLKDTNIQNKINNEIKELAHSMIKENSTGADSLNVSVKANYSNVLSLEFDKMSTKYTKNDEVETIDNKIKGLNYNLVTGEKLHLEDLFVSSAPIAAIVSDAAYNALAWDTNISFNMSEEELDKNINMDRRDTSNYEDELLAIVNKYKNKKDNIEFCFTETKLFIYDLVSDKLISSGRMSLNLMDYIQYLTIFKKYASSDIYTSNDIGMKNIYVYTTPLCSFLSSKEDLKYITYGKLTSNLFIDAQSTNLNLYNVNEDIDKKVSNDFNNRFKNIINNVKEKSNSNLDKGYVYQCLLSGDFVTYEEEYEPFIKVYVDSALSEMSRDFFDKNIFKELAKLAVVSKASVDGLMFQDNEYHKVEGITTKNERAEYYYDKNGNYLGDNKSVLKKKEIPKVEENTVEVEDNSIVDNQIIDDDRGVS